MTFSISFSLPYTRRKLKLFALYLTRGVNSDILPSLKLRGENKGRCESVSMNNMGCELRGNRI